jgi:hypothetical protein
MSQISDDRDTLACSRSKAERVEQDLVVLVDSLRALPLSGSNHIHVLFAELYLLSTRNWLSRLAGEQGSEFAYRVIPIFFDHYRVHVLDQLDQPLESIAPHWRNYHRLARRLTIGSPISTHLLLISLGVRAHVHLDFGITIHQVEAELALPQKEWASAHLSLFNRLSEEAFIAAALQYVEGHCARQTSWRRSILRLFRFGLVTLRPIWLRTLQQWRMRGYERTSKIHMRANISRK